MLKVPVNARDQLFKVPRWETLQSDVPEAWEGPGLSVHPGARLGHPESTSLDSKSTELREHFPAVVLRSHQHGDQPSWFAQDRKDPRPVNTSVLGAGGRAD